jgi:hypothetical protein
MKDTKIVRDGHHKQDFRIILDLDDTQSTLVSTSVK